MGAKSKGKDSIDMINGPLFKPMLFFAIPLALSSLLQLLFNAADIVVVGRFAGTEALAAVGATSTIVTLVVNILIGLMSGANIIVAKDVAMGNDKKISTDVHTSFTFALLFGLIAGVLLILSSHLLLIAMGTPAEIIDRSILYIRIVFIGLPATAIYNCGAAFFNATGNTRFPMIILLLSGIINVILNLVFVIGFNMSVAGVALATCISNYISALLVLIRLMKGMGKIKLSFKKLTIQKSVLKDELSLGIPSALQSAMFNIANILIQASINSLGAVYIAATSAASSIENFQYVLISAYSITCMTFASQNIGARKFSRIGKIMRTSILSGFFMTLLIGIAMFFSAEFLVGIYNSDPEVIAIGAGRIKLMALCVCVESIMNCYSSTYRALGHPVAPMIISLVTVCIFRVIWLATVFKMPAFHNYTTILLSWPISWVLCISAQVIHFPKVRKAYPKVDMA